MDSKMLICVFFLVTVPSMVTAIELMKIRKMQCKTRHLMEEILKRGR